MDNNTLFQYDQNREAILELKELPEVTLTKSIKEGKWSIKEIVGHLYYWDKFLLEKMVPEMVDGGVLPTFPNHEEYNQEALIFISKFSTTLDLLEEFSNLRSKLINELVLVSPKASFTVANGKRQFTIDYFIEMFVDHDRSHLEQIDSFLKSK